MTAKPPDLDPLLNINSVAAWADLKSTRHVRRLVGAGKLPKPDTKIGAGWRWKQSTLEKWLSESKF